MSKSKTQKNEKTIELEQKIADLKENLARSLADYSNLEKRIEGQRQLFVTLATTAIVTKMIEVLDDLFLAQNHLNDPGLKMAIEKFLAVLKSEGVEKIEAEGKEFDPHSMDCIDVAEGKQDHVVSVKKQGYSLNGHIIRPAQVVVGRESKTTSN